MSDGKTILVDVSRCTGCRGCQVACKQWNELPATDTVQTGSYQNPPDMNGDTYKIVRFREGRHENGKPYWNFFTDMCRHCVNPPCALMSRPDLVMLDEPSLGLAPLLVREIFDIILKINAEGKTVLLVEQNALAALSIAHYAYVLEVGRVVAEAPGQELLKDPKVKEAYLGG